MFTVSIENSEIKGYHCFQRRPIPEIGLHQVLPEENIRWDEYAMAIYMPRLKDTNFTKVFFRAEIITIDRKQNEIPRKH